MWTMCIANFPTSILKLCWINHNLVHWNPRMIERRGNRKMKNLTLSFFSFYISNSPPPLTQKLLNLWALRCVTGALPCQEWCQERWQRIQLNSLVGLLKIFSNLNSLILLNIFPKPKSFDAFGHLPKPQSFDCFENSLKPLDATCSAQVGDREGGGDWS